MKNRTTNEPTEFPVRVTGAPVNITSSRQPSYGNPHDGVVTAIARAKAKFPGRLGPLAKKHAPCILGGLGAPASANRVGAEINGVHQTISLHPVSKITTKWQAPAFLPA